MSQRDNNLLWLRDLLEHLTISQQQLEGADDVETIHLLADSMLRDLDNCRRLCERLRRQSDVLQAV
jgi:hypothetical protein